MRTAFLLILLASCGGDSEGEPLVPVDAETPDAARADAPPLPDAGPPTPIVLAPVGLAEKNVHDVAVDEVGGVWATTDTAVMYLPKGGNARLYTFADGLALGDPTVPFVGVGAGQAGQAVIGTWGRYVDVVDVRADGTLAIHHLTITEPSHVEKVTIGFRIVVDLAGPYRGTAWIGAEHGHSAVHGLVGGYCWDLDGCFEEHRHSDPSGGPSGDVLGLAVCPNHDVWTGDYDWIARMSYSTATPDFWAVPPDGYPSPLIDGWPGPGDSVSDMVCDENSVLWVGSYGKGLLRLDTRTLETESFTTALPQLLVTAVETDVDGSVWVATAWGGLARYQPRTGTWTRYDETSGLPSNTISALAMDRTTTPRTLYIAHARGLSAYRGP